MSKKKYRHIREVDIDIEEMIAGIKTKIRKEMVDKCWSNVTASQYAGISKEIISVWLNDHMRFEQFVALTLFARAFGFSLDWLAGRTEVREMRK
jgi:hypothetical protein